MWKYDVRGEIFGSGGTLTAGDVRRTNMTQFDAAGLHSPTTRLNMDLFRDAYTEEIASFLQSVRTNTPPTPGGTDARAALAIALACIRSVQSSRPVDVAER